MVTSATFGILLVFFAFVFFVFFVFSAFFFSAFFSFFFFFGGDGIRVTPMSSGDSGSFFRSIRKIGLVCIVTGSYSPSITFMNDRKNMYSLIIIL